jgi:tyrosyl-tRNA synthetase
MANASNTKPIDLIDELTWRGLLHQCTDEAGLRKHLSEPATAPRKIYAGFDPTAPSLTIGNLVPIMLLGHVKRAGHVPVVLMGGGTGLIGDPSGKSAERTLMTRETVETHINAQRPIFERVLGGEKVAGAHSHTIVNNADWLCSISYIDALRDIGKFFSVNMMMQKESVKARLENREQGISYTEFSYMILQAYDFWHLYQEEQVSVQMGGSDQFGNIVAGLDLIRRERSFFLSTMEVTFKSLIEIQERGAPITGRNEFESKIWRSEKSRSKSDGSSDDHFSELSILHDELTSIIRVAVIESDADRAVVEFADACKIFMLRSFGLTAPLVTKADGGKFGKTESGAIWLTADRTSPYAYYQFWLNASDADAANWIKVFTFLDKPTIDAVLERHAANPGARELQRTLAQEATTILHGRAAMEGAEAAAKALFSGDIAHLDRQTLLDALADVPSSNADRADLVGEGVDPVDLLVSTKLAQSKREAREFIANGSVAVNGAKLGEGLRLTESHLLHGSLMAIRRGKKNWHLIRWS